MESLYVPSNGVTSKSQITKRANEKFRTEDTDIITVSKEGKVAAGREKTNKFLAWGGRGENKNKNKK